jgi:uncharacterized damage-inducible protein DinB
MRITDPILAELEREAQTTRRVLERVPTDKLAFKPHPKSMSLGELAFHVASTPGFIAEASKASPHELNGDRPPAPTSTKEILAAFDASVAGAKKTLQETSDDDALSTWKLTKGGKELFSSPKIGLFRAIMLNHTYHHRGQLSVYLRLLDVPVPSIYGPSADENPFG